MTERFFLPEPFNQPELVLGGPEAHHLMHVLRLGPGDNVVLFDGQGTEAEAVVVSVTRRDVRLRPAKITQSADPISGQVTLAVAPPKGDRFRWLVEKATELGVTRLIPLQTSRTVVDPGHGKLDKLRQTIIAACKQSRRNRLMEITQPMLFSSVISNDAENQKQFLMLHPSGERFTGREIRRPVDVTILIGPEGGFSDEEVGQARRNGVMPLNLGPTILRTETAGIVGAALVIQSLQQG